ncbi:MAG: PAC2 family protein [candidate division WOR-3 bacterium]|nr:MAG: PAC2 family protein [candidate division WOR-3 bacterium]
MGTKIYKEPDLKNPVLLCGWPGIGNIGLTAIDSLKRALDAEELGEIEPWDFFYPHKVVIENGLLKDLEFPKSKFYFKKLEKSNLLFFIADEQPAHEKGGYATGEKAYDIANLVLDVALKFGCQRVYTSGAAVATVHHTAKPRVWAVPNSDELIDELRNYNNTFLMSEIEGRRGQGTISGLNGLMLGIARKRGLEAICIMGEIPYYLQWIPFPYPRASQSVLEVLTRILNIDVDFTLFNQYVKKMEKSIEDLISMFLKSLPENIREKLEAGIEDLKGKPAQLGPITDQEVNWFKEHGDRFLKEFLKKEDKENERPL